MLTHGSNMDCPDVHAGRVTRCHGHRVTVPEDDRETEARLEAFDLMRDALRDLLEVDLFDAGHHARARAALAAADAAVEGDRP
jgi:hypothetical protein